MGSNTGNAPAYQFGDSVSSQEELYQAIQESENQAIDASSNETSSSNYVAIQYSGSTSPNPNDYNSGPSDDPNSGDGGNSYEGSGNSDGDDGGENYENFFTTGSGGSTYVKSPVSPYNNVGNSDDGPEADEDDYYAKGGFYTESTPSPNYGDDGNSDDGNSDGGESGNIGGYREFYTLSSSALSASTTSPYSVDENSGDSDDEGSGNRILSGFAPPRPVATVLTPIQALNQATAQQTTRTVTLSDFVSTEINVVSNPQSFDALSTNNNGRSIRTYTDLDLFFTKKIHNSDVNILTDIESVKRSVRNLVLLNTYEKPFHPEISSGIRGMLFELMTPVTAVILSKQIEDVIINFEPRVRLASVRTTPDLDKNAYEDSIEFYVVNTPTELVELTLFLERLR